MIIYLLLEAIVGIVAGIWIAVRTKKSQEVTYGTLDKVGIATNIILIPIYVILSPVYLFLGLLGEPDCEGILWILALLIGIIVASASMFCSLGLGFSVALRKKGKSKLSFIVQFAGFVGIALTIILYGLFEGSLLSTLN